jgi:hypothetical protein
MSKFQLFAPTTAPVDPTGNMRIPALVWSPDAELCRTVKPAPDGGQGTVTDIYMGSERAPRAIRITMTGDPLPGDEIWITEADSNGTDHWPIHRLHDGRRSIVISGPIEGLNVSKGTTDGAVGAICTGYFGQSGSGAN